MEVVTVPLSKLKPDSRNSRGYNRRNIEAIKDSLPSRYLRTYGKPEVFWTDVPNETGLKYLPTPPGGQLKTG